MYIFHNKLFILCMRIRAGHETILSTLSGHKVGVVSILLYLLRLLWRTAGIAPTSATAWDRTRAALAWSKALNHYPVVAAYFRKVRCAGSSTGLPPSIEVASGLLVSEMLKRSVEEEDCTQWRSGCSDSDTACDLRISRRGHHFGGL